MFSLSFSSAFLDLLHVIWESLSEIAIVVSCFIFILINILEIFFFAKLDDVGSNLHAVLDNNRQDLSNFIGKLGACYDGCKCKEQTLLGKIWFEITKNQEPALENSLDNRCSTHTV